MSLPIDPACASNFHDFHLNHIDLNIDVDFGLQRIVGKSILQMSQNENSSSLDLFLDVFHLDIKEIEVTTDPNRESIKVPWEIQPFTSFGDKLRIDLRSNQKFLEDNNCFSIVISYEAGSGPGICWLNPEQTAGKKYPYMYTQGQEVLNRSFFPCQDSPCVRITYAATVTVPAHLTCLMSAACIRKSDPVIESKSTQPKTCQFDFEMHQSIPVYLVAMIVGNVECAKVGPRSTVWTEPCMLEKAQAEFSNVTEEYIAVGEKLFGEYLWEVYDIVVMPPCFPYGGMENPRLTFVSSSLLAGDQSLSPTIAHEISHSWFGNLVTNSTWSDFFLNEGFTMYAQRRLVEKVHGSALACMEAKTGQALLREEILALGEKSVLTRLRVPLNEGIDPGDCYNQCAYEKGYAFVCYLQNLSGSKETFDDFLKSYCAKFKFQSINAETLISYFISYFNFSDEDLQPHISFETWLHEPGFPFCTPDLSAGDTLIKTAENLANDWASEFNVVCETNQPLFVNSHSIVKWPVFQVLHFLDTCVSLDFNNTKNVLVLGLSCKIKQSTNAEIQFRWCQLLIKNGLLNEFEDVRHFLTTQGKQKYIIPLYRLLCSRPKTSKIYCFAKEIYEKTQKNLHCMVQERVDRLFS